MHIKEITSQYRRDFYAIFECEHCGHTCKDRGYDDANFHQRVVPELKCPACQQTASADYTPRDPKYAAYEVV